MVSPSYKQAIVIRFEQPYRHLLVYFLVTLQVFAIEFVPFAIEFVGFAIEFVGFAIEFVRFAIEFVGFAIEFVINKTTPRNQPFIKR